MSPWEIRTTVEPRAQLIISGCGNLRWAKPGMPMLGGGPQAKRILARRNHRQGDRLPNRLHVGDLEIQPLAQPGIVDFRLALPELRGQVALDIQMIQLQFDDIDVLRKVAPYILRTDLQTGHFMSLASRSNQHLFPPSSAAWIRLSSFRFDDPL